MKILLDECLPLDFRRSFPEHEVHSAEWAGLKGKKNGELLRDAELAGYEVLLTVDQGIPHQQNRMGRKVSVITIRSRTNQLEDLVAFVEPILNALEKIRPGEIVQIG
jgi:predicted nuclease of predicted toxin-antitoxin system